MLRKQHSVLHPERYHFIDILVLAYVFLLAMLIVTPQYYFINYLSIGLCLISFPFIPLLTTIRSVKVLGFYLVQLIWLLIGLFFVNYTENAVEGLISLTKNILTAIVPALFINSKKKLTNVLWLIVLAGSINVAKNIVTGISSLTTGVRFISEEQQLSLNNFAHGTFIYVIAAFFLFFLINNKLLKGTLLFFFSMAFLSLMITGSRQSIISIIAFLSFLALFKMKRFSVKKLLALLVILTFSAGIIYFVFSTFSNSPMVRRFTEGGNAGDDERMTLFLHAWDLFLMSPIFGYGIDTFRYYSNFVYTHSTYSELLFTGGLIYTLLFLIFYIKVFFSMKKTLVQSKFTPWVKREYEIIIAIILCILVNGFFYLIHASRLALTFQFIIINYFLTIRASKSLS